MERLIRKMGDDQAAKQSLGMSMWLKKVENKQQAQPLLEEHAPSDESRCPFVLVLQTIHSDTLCALSFATYGRVIGCKC